MQLNQSVRLKQKQSMVMTPRLQQAIRMLQMSNIDLAAYLEDQALENPFLDLADQKNEAAETRTEKASDQEALDKALENGTGLKDDPGAAGDYDNRLESGESDAVWRAELTQSSSGSDWDMIAMNIADRRGSLYAHVQDQMALILLDSRDRILAQPLIEALLPSGWLGREIKDIADEHGCRVEELERVLGQLQTMEPSGLFARNLSECLTLQAADQNLLTPMLETFLAHLPLLASGELRTLQRKCACSPEDLQNMLRLIRSFNPKPGEEFMFGDDMINTPDLITYKGKEGWVVELNHSTLPAITINEKYAEELAKKKAAREAEEFTQNALSSARWLKRALEQRNATTLTISAEIVRRQQDFLENGIDALKPLLLRDVASAIGMHESTVSRVTTGLMITTPRGSFSLKAFFSTALANNDEDDDDMASTASVRNMISKLVAAEDPRRPLSDELIAEKVSGQGIKLARRTVAKYRQMLKIPSSAERRRRAKLNQLTR